MKLPMMLRTTTQRGLFHIASIRSVLTRNVASSVQFGRSNRQIKFATSIPTSALSISSAPKARSFSTSLSVAHPTAKYTASPLTDGEYHKLSNNVLDSLTETFETLLEEADIETLEEQAREKGEGANRGSPASEWDIECASGVMNLRCGVHGTWVINKQPPNKQIWLSSPKSGPKRFDYDADSKTWFCLKEGETSTLHELLQTELSQVFETEVEVLLEDE
ncbi:related to YFH1 - mitochondrial matrix iron chaperone [Ustilago trichophora]|uniref:Related to YFH1 - mitochondrial matrix iron chaperone n=1 Tax=Ustilago trichophora TaxID=86804 RepID=A0A5C3EJA8_9BASI|nr:related to YFH1 - mitochondrial matrix iron chaperone [Ustilago trichophora]